MTDDQGENSASVPEKAAHEQSVSGLQGVALSSMSLPQDYTHALGVKKVLTSVPVRKPGKQDFIRVHPDKTYFLQTMVLELKEEREVYLVARPLWDELVGELIPKALHLATNRQGTVFLWALRMPGSDGRLDNWSQSALAAAELAKKRWVRVAANMNLGAYEIFEAAAELSEPEWPEESFDALVKLAFKGYYIETLEHPVVRRLRGAA